MTTERAVVEGIRTVAVTGAYGLVGSRCARHLNRVVEVRRFAYTPYRPRHHVQPRRRHRSRPVCRGGRARSYRMRLASIGTASAVSTSTVPGGSRLRGRCGGWCSYHRCRVTRCRQAAGRRNSRGSQDRPAPWPAWRRGKDVRLARPLAGWRAAGSSMALQPMRLVHVDDRKRD